MDFVQLFKMSKGGNIMELIKIGTLVNGSEAINNIPQLVKHGFESFSLTFWQSTGNIDLIETAKRLRYVLDEKGINISFQPIKYSF